MEQKTEFYTLLDAYISTLAIKKQESFCIPQEKYNRIVHSLQLAKGAVCQYGTKFKFWCNQHFKLEKIGTNSIVYCVKTSSPVVTKEDMFDVISRCHEQVGHSGRDKTWNELRSNYSWVKQHVVELFLKTCTACTQRQPVKQPAAGKPMITLGFLLRVQIDLIDFRSRPDGDYKWILHARDHFSKFSWAYPLKTKCANEVAECLGEQFCVFGPPRILQSDNGREFTAHVINELTTIWPNMIIIHGRPRHPQSQGKMFLHYFR